MWLLEAESIGLRKRVPADAFFPASEVIICHDDPRAYYPARNKRVVNCCAAVNIIEDRANDDPQHGLSRNLGYHCYKNLAHAAHDAAVYEHKH